MRKLKKYSILSLILLLFLAYFLFLKLISTSDVKISINKETAIEYAIILADELNINYNGCKIMASFDMNQDEKAYLEFNKLKVDEISKTDIYSPYKWIIKFINNNGNKSEIYLTPQGDPYGFVNEMLNKENYNNTNTNILEKKIIEYAKNNLNTNLSNYIIIDSNKLFLNNGCVQYNYTYENKNLEGIPLRVNISVVGDQITSLFKYINIPSVFKNKYNNLKIFSNIIYQIGNLSMYLFYFFICCLLGIIYLIKNHFIIIRKSIFLGTIMASFELISQLNQLPANELSPKSVSYSSLILSIIMQFVINVIIFTIVVIVAEGLTRKAFPKHIQLWSILNREVLQSKQIFNQVIIGYILVIFKLLYTIILFNITTSYFDWWSPSGDSSFIVNTTYLPWLTPVLSAIRAGIMEELLCRAIPIASIILISKKMKFKNSIIFIVVLFQAIIFGLLHTFYPVYPWYARIIELFIPVNAIIIVDHFQPIR